MGYGILPYSVDIEHLRAPSTFTSESEEFFDWMATIHRSTIDSPSRRSALRELFFSTPTTGFDGSDYGHALRVLCERFGGALDNEFWYPIGSSWFDTVRDCLHELGVAFDPHQLTSSEPPVPLPPIDDFPVIGYLSHTQLAPIARTFDAADLSTIKDRFLAGSVRELQMWVRSCLERECDLVTFYT